MRNKFLSFGTACLLSVFGVAQAENYYVTPAAANGDGSNWENAMSLEAALLLAGEGDAVYVASGEYKALTDSAFTCTEANNGAVIYGSVPLEGEPPAFTSLADTAHITSRLAGNGKSVIEIKNSTVRWIGFEITGGTAQTGAGVHNVGGTLQCCIIHGNTAELNLFDKGGGGGVYNTGVLSDCVVRNNALLTVKANAGGGGIYNTEGGTVRNSHIHHNTCEKNGGGIFCNAQASISDCEVAGNQANGSGGGIMMENSTLSRTHIHGNSAAQQGTNANGGGVYALEGCLIDSCLIEGNVAFNNSEKKRKGFGGGANITGESRIQNCTIRNNLCTTDEEITDAHNGGGLYIKDGAEAINCLVVNNSTKGKLSASSRGGGIYCANAAKVINCTVAGNYSAGRGGGIQLNDGTVVNTIMWDNANSAADNTTLDMRIDGTSVVKNSLWSYYNKAAGLTAENNIEKADPLFRDAAGGDYRLLMGSPAVNAGLDGENPLDTDLDGEQRVAAGNIDLGAYELVYFLVHLPESVEGATLESESEHALKGESYSFSLVRDAEYDESVPVVTTNRPEDGELNGGEGAEGVFHYTIADIRSDITVTVAGLTLNPSYTVTLPEAIAGLTLTPAADNNEVRGGQDYSFTLALDADYDESVLEVRAAREGADEAETLTPDEDGRYTIADIRSAVAVSISGVTLNPERTVTLPEAVDGLTLTAETEGTTVRSGHDFIFTLALDADYDESEVVVEIARGEGKTPLAPGEDGRYTIADIRTDVAVSISGVTLNPERTVTLPATIEGAILTPATAENKVRSGHDFEFTLTLAEGYDRSTPVVTMTRQGATAETLTPDADGKYIISEVRTDVTVDITGIVENPSRLDGTDMNEVRIYTSDHALHVEADDAAIDIYTPAGMRWTTARVNGTASFVLPAGTYIVRHGERTVLVLVK